MREVGTKFLGNASTLSLALMGHHSARKVAAPTAPEYDASRKLTDTCIREP
jgi:hypothetical protein